MPIVMAQTLYHGLLKSRLDREAEFAFFDHLNYRFSSGVEYQSGRIYIIYLLSKFGHISMNRVQAMNFLVTNSVAVPIVTCSFQLYFSALTLLFLGFVICHPTNE